MSLQTFTPAVFESTAPEYVFLGVRLRVLLASRQTGGQFSMIEGIVPPGGDGGLHIHRREDESLYLIEGQLEVTIGDEVVVLEAGSSYFAPRGVPQRLRNLGTAPARAIVVTTPGGFDEFIACAGLQITHSAEVPVLPPPSPEQIGELMKLADAFGIQILKPPGVL